MSYDGFSKVDGLGFVVDFFDFGARPLHCCWLQKSGAQHPGLGRGFECVIQGTVNNYFNCLVDFILFHKALGVILRDQSGSIKDAFLFQVELEPVINSHIASRFGAGDFQHVQNIMVVN